MWKNEERPAIDRLLWWVIVWLADRGLIKLQRRAATLAGGWEDVRNGMVQRGFSGRTYLWTHDRESSRAFFAEFEEVEAERGWAGWGSLKRIH